MSDSRNPHAGIEALLTPQNSVLLLIDHQGFQFANLHSHEPQLVVNNVVGLAKTAKLFGVPTILTTVLEERRLQSGISAETVCSSGRFEVLAMVRTATGQ